MPYASDRVTEKGKYFVFSGEHKFGEIRQCQRYKIFADIMIYWVRRFRAAQMVFRN